MPMNMANGNPHKTHPVIRPCAVRIRSSMRLSGDFRSKLDCACVVTAIETAAAAKVTESFQEFLIASPSGNCTRSDRYDKVVGGGGADILDAMLIVGMDESDAAWPQPVARTVDRQFHSSFAD